MPCFVRLANKSVSDKNVHWISISGTNIQLYVHYLAGIGSLHSLQSAMHKDHNLDLAGF